MTPILLKPKGEINMRFSKQHKRQQLQEIGISQGDVQQLLHILRGQLESVSYFKTRHKIDAAEIWEECDKDFGGNLTLFKAFSQTHKAFIENKTQEKKLVNLIAKLKGLR